jgi:hypothetical protein
MMPSTTTPAPQQASPAPAEPKPLRPRALRCGCRGVTIHRVKASAAGPWILACPMCSAKLREASDEYVYGGRLRRHGRRTLPVSWALPRDGSARKSA